MRKTHSRFLVTGAMTLSIFFVLPNAISAQQEIQQETEPDEQNFQSYAEGQILVKFKKEAVDVSEFSGQLSISFFAWKNDLENKEILEPENLALMESQDESTNELIQKLENDPRIEYIEPNYRRSIEEIPEETMRDNNFFGEEQPGISNIIQENRNTIVAILDTGIAYQHPDLAAKMWDGKMKCRDNDNAEIREGCPNHGWDFANNDNDPQDDHGHGTHVAGIISGQGGSTRETAGMHWSPQIMAVKVGNPDGIFSSDWIKGLNFAKNNGAKVANASFGGFEFSQAEKDAIDHFDGLFVAAAGNFASDNDSQAFYPAAYESANLISVAAMDRSDGLAFFSNFGFNSVDIAAPGFQILSTFPDFQNPENGMHKMLSGTSMAAPFVSGEAAMLWSFHPALTVAQVKEIIQQSGDDLPSLTGKIHSGKRINPVKALETFAPALRFSGTPQQLTDGSGKIRIDFQAKDGLRGIGLILKNFQYSLDAGVTFQSPRNGDTSLALSDLWHDQKNLVFPSAFEDGIFSFEFNTKHEDVSEFANAKFPQVAVRFQVSDSAKDSEMVTSDFFPVNTIPPVIVLESPDRLEQRKNTTFTVKSESATNYRSEFDGITSPETPIETPITLTNLTDGAHQLTVIATDAQGNTQLEPMILQWTTDRSSIPLPTIITDTTPLTNKNTATFEVTGSNIAGSIYQLDTNNFSEEKKPEEIISLTDLADGSHTIKIIAKNENNFWQFDEEAFIFSWLIDTTAPTALIKNPPAIGIVHSTTDTSFSFTIEGLDVTHYKFRLDGGTFTDEKPISENSILEALKPGPHTLEIIGRDTAGNYQSEDTATRIEWNIISPPAIVTAVIVTEPISTVEPVRVTLPEPAQTITPEPVRVLAPVPVIEPVPTPVPAPAPEPPPPAVSSGTSSGGGGSGSSGGGNFNPFSPPISTPVPTPIPKTPTPPRQVLGATTQRFPNSSILKVKGAKVYFLITEGRKKQITAVQFRRKYKNAQIFQLSRKAINSIPSQKKK